MTAGCYGKLPFHAEYLRVGLETAGAAAVVRWVDEAHAALSADRTRDPGPVADDRITLASSHSFALPLDDDGAYAAGVVARSSDGLREHPICLFSIVDSAEMSWALLPLAVDCIWTRLAELLRHRPGNRDELIERLGAEIVFPATGALESQLRDELEQQRGEGPWQALTGLVGVEAQHAAANLMAICGAQREARTADEGVAVSIPFTDPSSGSAHVAAWLALLSMLATMPNGPAIRPAIAFGGVDRRLFVFLRPTDGRDLATVLTRMELSPIDDLSEHWQQLPVEGTSRYEGIATFMADSPSSFTDLFDRAVKVIETWHTA